MKPQKLELITLDGENWITEAYIVDDLALHLSKTEPKRWVVTHVPTQMGFTKVVPPELLKSRIKMVKWMGIVQKHLLKDWMAMKKFSRADVLNNPERTEGIRARIREHCLNTKKV